MAPISADTLIIGTLYIKVHKKNGHCFPARKFLGMSEFGYALFEMTSESYRSESPELWDFYAPEDSLIPTPVYPPDDWVEGADGYHAPTKPHKEIPVH